MLVLKSNPLPRMHYTPLNVIGNTKGLIKPKELHTSTYISNRLKSIYDKYKIEKKWVLMIDPDVNTLAELMNNQKTEKSKTLQINTNKTTVTITNIKIALRKGNCSAVVLFNTTFNNSEISDITIAAKQSGTECIFLNSETLIH